MVQQEYISAEKQRRLIRITILISTFYILGHLLTSLYEIRIQRYDGWIADKATGIVDNAFTDAPTIGLNAGLKPGDEIISVNGKAWDNPTHDWSQTEQVLLILRDGQAQTIYVTTVAYPLKHKLLTAVTPLTGLGLWLFSIIIWLRKPYHRTVLLLVLTLQSLAVGMGNTTFVPPFGIFGLDARFLAGFLFTPVLIHFHLRLTRFHTRYKRLYPKLLILLYGATLILMGVYLFQTKIQHISLAKFNPPMLLDAMLAMIIALVLLIWAYIKGTPLVRQRLRIVLVGSAFVYLFWVILMLIPRLFLGIPSLFPVYIGYPILLLLPIVYVAGISRDGLFPTDKIINRAILSLGLIIVIGIFYLIIISIIPNLLPFGWVGNPFSWSVITLALVVLFTPLRTRLQNSADRLLYGGWYDYRSVVNEMSHKLSGIVDGKQLGRLLVDRLSEIMHLEGAALLLQRGEVLQPVHCTGGLSQPAQIALQTPLATALRQAKTPLQFEELQRHLPALQKQAVDALQSSPFDTWVPLVRNEQLLGVLLLGKRYGAESLLAEDREMLATLAWNAATAAENVQLVDTLEDRAAEISQLYDRVVSSREEERKRLARELHDQIIQDLINLNHAAGVGDDDGETVNFMRGQLQTTIEDLRRVCTDLRPSALDDLSFRLAVAGYVADISAETTLPITFSVAGDETRLGTELSDEAATALFRVLQEALTNIKRHAEATRVTVTLQIRPTTITLQICDDGKGFTVPAQLGRYTANGHFGLAGMQERLSLVGGKLRVDSAEGKGTCLQAII